MKSSAHVQAERPQYYKLRVKDTLVKYFGVSRAVLDVTDSMSGLELGIQILTQFFFEGLCLLSIRLKSNRRNVINEYFPNAHVAKAGRSA